VNLAVVSEESSKLEADSDIRGGCRVHLNRLVDDLAGAAVNMPAETQRGAEATCWLVSEKLWRWRIVKDDNLPNKAAGCCFQTRRSRGQCWPKPAQRAGAEEEGGSSQGL